MTSGYATREKVIEMDRLQADDQLKTGESLVSTNSRVRLIMQPDGNVVLYRSEDGRAMWASNTDGQPVDHLVMQGDGNLVAYSPDGQAFWASNTDGNPGASVVLQDDGNLVIYGGDGSALWASDHCP